MYPGPLFLRWPVIQVVIPDKYGCRYDAGAKDFAQIRAPRGGLDNDNEAGILKTEGREVSRIFI